jgi:hypothetical protein
MLQTYEAVLEPNGQLHFLKEVPASVSNSRHVLVTFTEPASAAVNTPNDWKQFVGSLKDSPNLNEDPLTIQQAMRHEWE